MLIKNFIYFGLLIIFGLLINLKTKADNHNIYEVLELIQKI